MITHIVAGAVAAVIAFGAAWQVQDYRYGEQINEIKLEQSEAARKVFEEAQRQHEIDLARKDKALHESNLRAQANANLARKLDSDVDSVRNELAQARASLPKATCDAARNYAASVTELFGSCADRYIDMARKAQGHAEDVRLMQEALP